MTDEDVDHINELFGDLAALHHAAREDEHRDGDKGDGVHLGEAVGEQLCRLVAGSVRAAEEYEPGAGGHEAHGDGDADGEGGYKYDQRDIYHERFPPLRKSFLPAAIISSIKYHDIESSPRNIEI